MHIQIGFENYLKHERVTLDDHWWCQSESVFISSMPKGSLHKISSALRQKYYSIANRLIVMKNKIDGA